MKDIVASLTVNLYVVALSVAGLALVVSFYALAYALKAKHMLQSKKKQPRKQVAKG